MKKLILLFAILFLVPSCKKSEYYIRFYFYINNQTSYDLELFKDYEYSATIKKNETYQWLYFCKIIDNIEIQYSLINDLIKRNNASVSLWKIKDNNISLAKKWRVENTDEEGKSIFRFSDYTLTDIYKHYRLHRTTIHEEFIITITDEDIL